MVDMSPGQIITRKIDDEQGRALRALARAETAATRSHLQNAQRLIGELRVEIGDPRAFDRKKDQ